MTTYLVTLVVFVVALAGMAIGVMLSGRRIKGTCGGLSSYKDRDGNSVCEACTNPSTDCTQRREREAAGHVS
jgi:hypothetical protein